MVGAAVSDDLVIGLLLGVGAGLLAGPFIRSWLVWREWSSASDEADRLEMDELVVELLGRPAEDPDASGREERDEANVGPQTSGRAPRKSWPR